jgi:phage-related protein
MPQEYNKAADATEDAIESAKGVAAELKKGVAEAAAAVSGDTDKAVEATEEGTSEAAAKAKDLGAQAKQATEDAWDGATDAIKGVTDKVAADAKAAAKE